MISALLTVLIVAFGLWRAMAAGREDGWTAGYAAGWDHRDRLERDVRCRDLPASNEPMAREA